LKDVWQARMTFEPPLAGLLAKTWDEGDMAKLRSGLEASRKALADPIKFAESQTDFHYLVVTLAGNRTLALMARLLNEVIRLHETAVNADPEHDPLRTAALKDHEDFVELLEGRREAEAEAFWRAHLETNAANLLGDSGPHTVLDLYSKLLARQELRLRL
jgi:DNA-binding FadR family transcriptional regulator